MLTLVVVALYGKGMSNAVDTRDKYRLTMNRMEDPVIFRFQKSLVSQSKVITYS